MTWSRRSSGINRRRARLLWGEEWAGRVRSSPRCRSETLPKRVQQRTVFFHERRCVVLRACARRSALRCERAGFQSRMRCPRLSGAFRRGARANASGVRSDVPAVVVNVADEAPCCQPRKQNPRTDRSESSNPRFLSPSGSARNAESGTVKRWRPLPGEQFKFEGVRSDRVLIPGNFSRKKNSMATNLYLYASSLYSSVCWFRTRRCDRDDAVQRGFRRLERPRPQHRPRASAALSASARVEYVPARVPLGVRAPRVVRAATRFRSLESREEAAERRDERDADRR